MNWPRASSAAGRVHARRRTSTRRWNRRASVSMVDDVDQAIDFYTDHFGFEPGHNASPAFAEVSRATCGFCLPARTRPGGRCRMVASPNQEAGTAFTSWSTTSTPPSSASAPPASASATTSSADRAVDRSSSTTPPATRSSSSSRPTPRDKGVGHDTPPVVSSQEWQAAREQLLVEEKKLTRARDALAAQRRRMPWMAVEKDYRFEGPDGPAGLLDLFEGRRHSSSTASSTGPRSPVRGGRRISRTRVRGLFVRRRPGSAPSALERTEHDTRLRLTRPANRHPGTEGANGLEHPLVHAHR